MFPSKWLNSFTALYPFFFFLYNLLSFFLPLSYASFIFSLFSYSTRQIIPQGIPFPASVQSCGSKEREEATLSHLESNRGPLSKKLISLNIILGASGSRRALTDPSPARRHKTLLSQTHASFLHRELGFPSPSVTPTRPSATALLFTLSPPAPSLPLIF